PEQAAEGSGQRRPEAGAILASSRTPLVRVRRSETMTSPLLRLGPLPPLRVSPGTLVTVLLIAVILYPGLSGPGRAPLTAVLLAVGIGAFMIVSVLVHEI